MNFRERIQRRSLSTYFVAYAAVLLLLLLAVTWYATEVFRGFFVDYLASDLEDRAYLFAFQVPELRADAHSDRLNIYCRTLGQRTKTRVTVMAQDGTVLCDSQAIPENMDNHLDRPEIQTALEGGVGSSIRRSDTLKTDFLYVAVPLVEDDKLTGVVRTAYSLRAINHHTATVFRKLAAFEVLVTALVALISWIFYRAIIPPLEEIRRGAERFARGDFDRKLGRYHLKKIDALASAMNSMGEQLKHLEQVRRDFVANVSHELKTPITSIKGFVETLLDGAKENPTDLDRFLCIILKQSERLTAIIEDLLTLARFESENVQELILRQDEHVDGILNAVADECRERAAKKNITVEVQGSFGHMINVDRALIEQALINLLDNAVKYSGENTTVRISAKAQGTTTVLEVKDQGPGIAAEHLPRLFERFYRVDKARSRELGGTGLGLAVVKHIAQLHEGSVSVASIVGKGSTFSMHLPRVGSIAHKEITER